jgi:hypothetical protein
VSSERSRLAIPRRSPSTVVLTLTLGMLLLCHNNAISRLGPAGSLRYPHSPPQDDGSEQTHIAWKQTWCLCRARIVIGVRGNVMVAAVHTVWLPRGCCGTRSVDCHGNARRVSRGPQASPGLDYAPWQLTAPRRGFSLKGEPATVWQHCRGPRRAGGGVGGDGEQTRPISREGYGCVLAGGGIDPGTLRVWVVGCDPKGAAVGGQGLPGPCPRQSPRDSVSSSFCEEG